jgi:hypothetical protein
MIVVQVGEISDFVRRQTWTQAGAGQMVLGQGRVNSKISARAGFCVNALWSRPTT